MVTCHVTKNWKWRTLANWRRIYFVWLNKLAFLKKMCFFSAWTVKTMYAVNVCFKFSEGRTGVFPWCVTSWFLFSVKREFDKLFFVIRDLKVLGDPWRTWIINRYSWFHHSIWRYFEMHFRNHILIEGLFTLGTRESVPWQRNIIVLCSHLECPICDCVHCYSISACQTSFWHVSLAASTKQWAAPELTVCTQGRGVLFCARVQGLNMVFGHRHWAKILAQVH